MRQLAYEPGRLVVVADVHTVATSGDVDHMTEMLGGVQLEYKFDVVVTIEKEAVLFTIGLKASVIKQDTSKTDMELASFQDIMRYIEKEETK